MWGNNHASTAQRGTAEFIYDNRNNADANFHIASYNGTTWTQKFLVGDNGAEVTGSLKVTGGGFTGSLLSTNGVLSSSAQVVSALPTGTVSSSGQVSYTGLSNIPVGIVSSSTQINGANITNNSVSYTAGSGLTGGGTATLGGGAVTINVGAGNGITVNADDIALNTSSAHFVTGARATISSADTTGASGINLRYNNLTGIISGSLVNSAVTVTAGSGLSGGGAVSLGGTTTVTLDTSSVHFLDGVKKELNTEGVISSSAQVDVRNTTGIATIATTGSNSFTGAQIINSTTNSTAFNNGALIVSGGVGIAKDVNISGSLTVLGLLTAVSTSIQYVTSSQLFVADNKIVVQTNDLVRFGGLSVYDSGSASPTTASIYWDSQNHKFIYENLSGSSYNSGMFIAGPANTGTLGNEVGLTTGRIPVASGADHIDSRVESSSIRVDFPSRVTHIEAGLYVTGGVTASAGITGSFKGDGSQLTGVATTLSISGSSGGGGSVSLQTQVLQITGSNGIVATANGQTLTISGSNATTTTKGVASFNSTNFTVTAGEVTSNNITINGTTVTLGGTRNITLAQITTQGATTTDVITLSSGSVIAGVLYSGSTNPDVDTGTEIVAIVPTGSYSAAFFDYYISSASNYRAGTVSSVWQPGTSNIEHTDVSTNDIGNTSGVTLSVDILGDVARLKATVGSDNWVVKSMVRAL
jgi:hypothetical protein